MAIYSEIKELMKTGESGGFVYYSGDEAYLKHIMLRLECRDKHILQVINGRLVADTGHPLLSDGVRKLISQRADKGITLNNLICKEDKDLEVEKSDSENLKETRVMPEGIQTDFMISIFDDIVAVTNLRKGEIWGIILENRDLADKAREIYWRIWELSEPN